MLARQSGQLTGQALPHERFIVGESRRGGARLSLILLWGRDLAHDDRVQHRHDERVELCPGTAS